MISTYLYLVRVNLDAFRDDMFHVFGIEIAESKSADAFVFGKETQSINVVRIIVLAYRQIERDRVSRSGILTNCQWN